MKYILSLTLGLILVILIGWFLASVLPFNLAIILTFIIGLFIGYFAAEVCK